MSSTAGRIFSVRRVDESGVPLDTIRIRELREKLGLSQEQAAQRAGLAGRQYWNRIETGRQKGLTLETLERIAGALGVKAKDLLK